MTDNYDPVGAVARCATELNIDSKGKMPFLKIKRRIKLKNIVFFLVISLIILYLLVRIE